MVLWRQRVTQNAVIVMAMVDVLHNCALDRPISYGASRCHYSWYRIEMNTSGRFGAFSRALVGAAIIGHTHTCSF